MLITRRNGNSQIIGSLKERPRSSLMVALFFKPDNKKCLGQKVPLKKRAIRLQHSPTSFILLDERGISADFTPRVSQHRPSTDLPAICPFPT